MLLPVGDYYAVVDINRASQELTVVAESDNRTEAEEIRDGLKMCDCEVIREYDGSIYRVICGKVKVESKPEE